MTSYLQNTVEYIAQLPVLIKCLVLIMATAIEYVFPIFPGDTIVLLTGFFHARGAIDLAETLISIIFGSLLGAYLGYKIGQYFLKQPRYNWAKKLSNSNAYKNFRVWYEKYGYWLLLFNRFIQGIRSIFFFAAGALNLPLYIVLVLGVFSAAMFNGLLLIVGYWLGYDTERILSFFYNINIFVYAVLVISIGFIIFLYKKHRK